MNILENTQGAPSKEKLVVMQGPLSEILYRALNDVYQKGGEQEQYDFSLETVAQDVEIGKAVMNEGSLQGPTLPTYMVYGVDKMDVEPEHISEVKSIVEGPAAPVLVLFSDKDAILSKDNQVMAPKIGLEGYHTSLNSALEAYVESKGGIVVHSLESLMTVLTR